ncbi:hypothetical protein BT63DRAFT_415947 [Microthyrium microscopicum]|uniref:Uncharacterized protein n=1 Tax=Microthyrium microscopicum TaxID=703497 RepID=A0A6A6U6D7_9PEZI|nr:hypothetical protein BT63DRAFT_415947 [Microthyrium microscopicum]
MTKRQPVNSIAELNLALRNANFRLFPISSTDRDRLNDSVLPYYFNIEDMNPDLLCVVTLIRHAIMTKVKKAEVMDIMNRIPCSCPYYRCRGTFSGHHFTRPGKITIISPLWSHQQHPEKIGLSVAVYSRYTSIHTKGCIRPAVESSVCENTVQTIFNCDSATMDNVRAFLAPVKVHRISHRPWVNEQIVDKASNENEFSRLFIHAWSKVVEKQQQQDTTEHPVATNGTAKQVDVVDLTHASEEEIAEDYLTLEDCGEENSTVKDYVSSVAILEDSTGEDSPKAFLEWKTEAQADAITTQSRLEETQKAKVAVTDRIKPGTIYIADEKGYIEISHGRMSTEIVSQNLSVGNPLVNEPPITSLSGNCNLLGDEANASSSLTGKKPLPTVAWRVE